MAETSNFLTEHGIGSMEELTLKMKHVAAYRQLKPIYDRCKAAKDKEKFLRGYESEIILFEAAALLLYGFFKTACIKDGQLDYLWLWILCGLPFGIWRLPNNPAAFVEKEIISCYNGDTPSKEEKAHGREQFHPAF